MKRRVGREDFKSASPFDTEELSGFFFWDVYEHFDIIEEDGRLPYFEASVDRGVQYYRPLVDTPYLFLEFARVAEHKGHPYEALDPWISKYGLLGLSNRDPEFSLGSHSEENWTPHADWYPEVSIPPQSYAPSGGPGDTLDAYMLEVFKANKLLTLYE